VILGVVDPSYATVEDHNTIHPRWLADQLGDTIITTGHPA